MKLRVCVCCGEPMSDRSRALSRDPNVCASCMSFLDVAEWSKRFREAGREAPPQREEPRPHLKVAQ